MINKITYDYITLYGGGKQCGSGTGISFARRTNGVIDAQGTVQKPCSSSLSNEEYIYSIYGYPSKPFDYTQIMDDWSNGLVSNAELIRVVDVVTRMGYTTTVQMDAIPYTRIDGSTPPAPAQKPVISELTASMDNVGTVKVTWNQNVAGSVLISIDGTEISQRPGSAGNNVLLVPNQSNQNHQVCVEAA